MQVSFGSQSLRIKYVITNNRKFDLGFLFLNNDFCGGLATDIFHNTNTYGN